MSSCLTHKEHSHIHGAGCGHPMISHQDHTDYLHEGHLHRVHENHADECKIAQDQKNPKQCTPAHRCSGHLDDHIHGPKCGHEPIPHGDHVDYLVGNHLHHPHEKHCDHHGNID